MHLSACKRKLKGKINFFLLTGDKPDLRLGFVGSSFAETQICSSNFVLYITEQYQVIPLFLTTFNMIVNLY